LQTQDVAVFCCDLSVPKKEIVFPVAALLAVVVVLFDIDISPEFEASGETQQLDHDQEARFRACVDEKDRLVHAETFSGVDNPDVQREMLMTGKDQLVRECREEFPETRVTVTTPFRFKLLDVKFRY
jgi:hypothetical protein